jgi:hypothetical protein
MPGRSNVVGYWQWSCPCSSAARLSRGSCLHDTAPCTGPRASSLPCLPCCAMHVLPDFPPRPADSYEPRLPRPADVRHIRVQMQRRTDAEAFVLFCFNHLVFALINIDLEKGEDRQVPQSGSRSCLVRSPLPCLLAKPSGSSSRSDGRKDECNDAVCFRTDVVPSERRDDTG